MSSKTMSMPAIRGLCLGSKLVPVGPPPQPPPSHPPSTFRFGVNVSQTPTPWHKSWQAAIDSSHFGMGIDYS